MRLQEINVSLDLKVIQLSGKWVPNNCERKAAWELYVELITRVAVIELGSEEGLIREALSSLHSLFETTRSILRRYGPNVAIPKRAEDLSFGFIAVQVINAAIRPFLAKWHPLLRDHEERKPHPLTSVEHERNWEYEKEVRVELELLRPTLQEYADILGKVAGVVKPLYRGD